MSKLVIVESPAKAKTINKYLGKEFQVKASFGHVRDLPKSKLGVDIEHDFAPQYVAILDRKKILSELTKLSKKADEVYLATDLDREGEAIAWHLAQAMKLPKAKTRRVVFNEITKNAIRAAFQEPLTINENKVNAQQARRILDRIVGYQLSPLLWTSVRRGLSAGRVQSVTVRLIVEREREIEAFKAEEYWEIAAVLTPIPHPKTGPKEFTAELAEIGGGPLEAATQAQAEALVKELQERDYLVRRVETKERLLPPAPPFNTSTLQQQGSIRLHFSSKRTMRLAQMLYEGVELGSEGSVGLITYMRTDSLRISDQAIAECRDFIKANYAPEYLPDAPRAYRSGSAAQGAHEAIRPTSVAYTPEKVKPFLEAAQFRLYELIWNRFVASQMQPGRVAVTDVEVVALPRGQALDLAAEKPPENAAKFTVQGRTLVFSGHTALTGFDKKSELRLPPVAPGGKLDLVKLDPSQHFTKPPPRFTEATLIKMLEKLGVGRPSTYAPIISTIQAREYVRLDKRQFFATDLGKVVTDQLVANFSDIMNVKFTSHMEESLDQIEEAKTDWLAVLREFYTAFSSDIAKAKKTMKRPEPTETEYKCEKCGKPMLKRWSARGEFLGCSGYPECRSTMPLDAEGKPAPRPEPEKTEEKCDKCGSPMVIRSGRHGRFMACSAYPKCKNTKSLDAPIDIPDDLKTCDKCGKPMAVRRSRRGPFLGCTGYPECKNAKPLPKEKKAEEKPEGEPAAEG